MYWDSDRLALLIAWGGLTVFVARVAAYELLIARLKLLGDGVWVGSSRLVSLRTHDWLFGCWSITSMVMSGRYRRLDDAKVQQYASSLRILSVVFWVMLMAFLVMVFWSAFPKGLPHG